MTTQLQRQRGADIASRGRPMTLRRVATTSPSLTFDTCTLNGFSSTNPDAEPLAGAGTEAQRRRRVELGLLPEDWTVGAPRNGDELLDGLVTYAVEAAEPVYDGPVLIGWRLWVEGGTA